MDSSTEMAPTITITTMFTKENGFYSKFIISNHDLGGGTESTVSVSKHTQEKTENMSVWPILVTFLSNLGFWQDNLPHGEGTLYNSDGSYFEGKFNTRIKIQFFRPLS